MEEKIYQVGNKNFVLKNDFTFEELEWLDVVYYRIAKGTEASETKNEITGAFTREEIERTVTTLLQENNGNNFTHEDFMKMRESQSVKVIADFFLQKAILGAYTESVLRN